MRAYTSRRNSIATAIADVLKTLDGSGEFQTDLEGRVNTKLKFFDEINTFPEVCVSVGSERRVYHTAGYKDRFLNVVIRCYVKDEESADVLEGLLEDIETVLEENSRLVYKDRLGASQCTQEVTILSIDTDEGVLNPLGVGEIICEVRY